ncbi:2'-5' RNA ligase family protein [Streptomyces sp. NPDC059373]
MIDYFRRLREVAAAFPEVIAPVADADLHMTIQSIKSRDTAGERVGADHLRRAASALRRELTSLEPFDLDIGPTRASGSAAIVEIWPEEGPAALNRRVRRALVSAGLDLPPAEDHFWCHMSLGYGITDTDTPELAARSDQLASALGQRIRPGIRTWATVSSVWLVWERQHPDLATYTFEPIHEIHLAKDLA